MTQTATRHRHAHGAPCWASLMVYGLSASQEFYHALLGWEFREGPDEQGASVRAVVNGHEVAGMRELNGRRPAPRYGAWLPYFCADDADTCAALIRECGGTVAVGPLDLEGAGRMAIASDPAGASFGVWQPGPREGGLGTAEAGAPGAPVWYELVTRNTASVVKFYAAVFGHDAERFVATEGQARPGGAECGPDAGYVTLRLNTRPVAGIHGVGPSLTHHRGPYWETYFAVEAPDAAAKRTVELGGSVVRAPRDTPHGRLATLADPEGARFSVIRPAERALR